MSAHIIRLHVPGSPTDVEVNLDGDELVGWTTEPGIFHIWFNEAPTQGRLVEIGSDPRPKRRWFRSAKAAGKASHDYRASELLAIRTEPYQEGVPCAVCGNLPDACGVV